MRESLAPTSDSPIAPTRVRRFAPTRVSSLAPPQSTVVYYHGGFWAAGNKEGAVMKILPWMEMG